MLYFYIILSAVVTLCLNVPLNFFESEIGIVYTLLIFIGLILAFLILHFGILCIIILLTDREKTVKENFSKFFRSYVKLTLPIFFKLARVDITLSGEEKIPQDQRVLLVCNHIDNFDPVVIINSLPDLELAFIGKKEIYSKMVFVSKAMHLIHGLYIDRDNDRKAVETIVKASKLIKEDICSVCIFPEGYTSRDGRLQPFRNGAFKIATKSKAPIVVCTVSGTDKIVKNMFRRKTQVTLKVLDVVYTDEKGITTHDIGEAVHSTMLSDLEG